MPHWRRTSYRWRERICWFWRCWFWMWCRWPFWWVNVANAATDRKWNMKRWVYYLNMKYNPIFWISNNLEILCTQFVCYVFVDFIQCFLLQKFTLIQWVTVSKYCLFCVLLMKCAWYINYFGLNRFRLQRDVCASDIQCFIGPKRQFPCAPNMYFSRVIRTV